MTQLYATGLTQPAKAMSQSLIASRILTDAAGTASTIEHFLAHPHEKAAA
jgi:hypothetical protein